MAPYARKLSQADIFTLGEEQPTSAVELAANLFHELKSFVVNADLVKLANRLGKPISQESCTTH